MYVHSDVFVSGPVSVSVFVHVSMVTDLKFAHVSVRLLVHVHVQAHVHFPVHLHLQVHVHAHVNHVCALSRA